MVLVEFRIPLPLTCDEFQRGQLYMVAQQSLEATQGDEGVEWLKNEPYDNTDGRQTISPITGTMVPKDKGQYTLKRYLLKSKMPSFLGALVPNNALFLIEEAWNAYPYCKTVLVNGYLDKNKFRISVETMHVDNNTGDLPNAVNLSDADLKARKIEILDIRTHSQSDPKSKEYNPKNDATKFKSTKTGRGPLAKGWEKAMRPTMCCYKVVKCEFKYFGLQNKVESLVVNAQRDIFARTLSSAFCNVDDWFEMTWPQIRALENEVAAKAAKSLKNAVQKTAAIPVAGAGAGGEPIVDAATLAEAAAVAEEVEATGSPVTAAVAAVAEATAEITAGMAKADINA